MTRTQAPRQRVSGWTALLVLACVAMVMLLVAYGAWRLATVFTGDPLPGNPFVAFGYSRHRATWTPLATVFTVIAELALICAAMWAARRWTRRPDIDKRATLMAGARELSEVAGRSAVDKAKRLRPDAEVTASRGVGLLLGRTVQGDQPVYQSWEDVLIAFAGMRMGKTAGLAIGSVIDAPGPVIATSNKRDLRDHTRGVREAMGGRTWESDLQGITGHPHQDWYWNPLGNVTSLKAARRLASRFVSAEKVEDARVDAYFDGGAAELLALYFLAAASGGGDVMHSYAWLSLEDSKLPNKLLERAGHQIAATKLATAQKLYPKQRDGLYDVARRNLNVLTDPDYARTVLPPARIQIPGDDTDLADWLPTHSLPEFDPAAFVRSTDVLYAMSMEGADSAAALTTTLVGRVIDEALALARRSPGGRLPVPLVGVLDEAANVCKLPELPSWYSHIGSQGIICQTYVQSGSQAADVWSPRQLDKMKSSSNVHYYGGGVKDIEYLNGISQEIGSHDVSRWSSSHSSTGASQSQSWSHEVAVPVSMLAALPKDRAIVMTSGNAPTVIRKAFWSDRPDADAIRASVRTYGESAEAEPVYVKELL